MTVRSSSIRSSSAVNASSVAFADSNEVRVLARSSRSSPFESADA
jgi:hypothetical protein